MPLKSQPGVSARSSLAPRLVVSLIATLALVSGPLAFAPAQAAMVTVRGMIEVVGGDSRENVTVELQKWVDGSEDEGEVGWGPANVNSTAYTDGEGRYEFSGVQSGLRYRVTSQGPVEVDPDFQLKYATNETAEFEVADIPVTAPTLRLKLGGTISGSISGEGKTGGLADGRVVATRLVDGRYQYERAASSGQDGSYSVTGLRDGTYRLEFSAAGRVAEYFDNVIADVGATGFVELTIKDGTAITSKNAALGEAAVVSGHVTGATGDLDSIAVSAYRHVVDEDGARWEPFERVGFTDAGGYYELNELPAGIYRIGFEDYTGGHVKEFYNDKPSVESPGVVDFKLAAGETAEADAVLAPAGAISGTVLGPDGDVVEGGCVYAYRKTDGTYREEGSPMGFTGYGSDAYTIGGLAVGTYKVKFADCGDGTLAPEYFDNQETLAAATEVSVLASTTQDGIDGSLAPAQVEVPVMPTTPYTPPTAPAAPAPPAVPGPVAKKSASISVSAKGGKKKASLTIAVKAAGVTPTGKVTIKLGSKTLKNVTLRGGKIKVTLTKQKKGSRTYKISYSGDSKVRSKSTTSKVKIK